MGPARTNYTEGSPTMEPEPDDEVPCEEADALENALANLHTLKQLVSIHAARLRKRARDKHAVQRHRARAKRNTPLRQQQGDSTGDSRD